MPQAFPYRVSFVGCPAQSDVPWTREHLQWLADHGFNTMQLNIAWGCRPNDEPLNLEDVVDCTDMQVRQSLPLASDVSPERVARRRDDLRQRIALCRGLGLRTIFHFGAPYNQHARHGDTPPNCLMDEAVRMLYRGLIERFDTQFPGVDDLLVYTYDQDAWLCSEFGGCPRCSGVPLHERVSDFVNHLARAWHALHPDGRLWWEPWELSAGQVLSSIDRLDGKSVGLSLHSNVAEVMATMPVDRWLKNSVAAAKRAGLPVIVEHFLGGPTEEVEPYTHLSWPAETWRGVRAIADLSPDGIKEYYGTVPGREDVNLRMTSLLLENPEIALDAALDRLAEPYGACHDSIIRFWHATSTAMALFPWDASWFIREIGRSDPHHGMDAAFIRGQQAHTPSWESSRRAVFMFTDNRQPDPWALEDVQLRCRLCADELQRAMDIGGPLPAKLAAPLAGPLTRQLEELAAWRQRALSYASHLRETNLCAILRGQLEQGRTPSPHVLDELRGVLREDLRNQHSEEPCRSALALLDGDLEAFLERYFLVRGEDQMSKGVFTTTSK